MARVKSIFVFTFISIILLAFPACDSPDSDKYPDMRPKWTAEPAMVTIIAGESYRSVNGSASDDDKPDSESDDPGYLRCVRLDTDCSFSVDYFGRGSGAVDCELAFTGTIGQTCTATLAVRDGFGKKTKREITIEVTQTLDISDCLPDPVAEGGSVSCAVAALGGTPEIDPGNDTCGGVLNGAGPWTYDFTSTEAQGPGGCVAAVQMVENDAVKDVDNVAVDEINAAPTIALACPANVAEDIATTCSITAGDTDLPDASPGDPGYYACSVNAGLTSCAGAAVTGCSQVDIPAQGEAAGPGSCDVTIDIADGFGAAARDTATITIEEVNAAPTITNLPAVESGHWGGGDAFMVTGTDADLPADSLNFGSAGDTCSFTVDVAANGNVTWTCGDVETCDVDVVLSDDGTPAPQLSDTETLTIQCMNNAPEIRSVATTNMVENGDYSYDIICFDADGDTLILDVGAGDDCGGGVSDNGDGTGTYSFSADETRGGTTCNVEVTCTDTQDTATQGPFGVTIAEDNRYPAFTNLPATFSGHWGRSHSYDADASDPDDPADSLTYSLWQNACGFTINVDADTGEASWTCNGVETCDASIMVIDDGTPAPQLSDTETLTIQCMNNAPAITSTPGNATEHAAYLYNIVCADSDGDTRTISKSAGDTCGGVVADNGDGTGTYSSWTPGETDGGSTCVVGVQCTDTQDTDTDNITINIAEAHAAPTWTAAPTGITIGTESPGYNAVNGAVADTDLPNSPVAAPGYVSCVKASSTCSFDAAISVTGSGAGSASCNISFAPPMDAESCTLTLRAIDGAGYYSDRTISIQVNQCLFFVDGAVAGTGGRSWGDAFGTIQQAVDAADALKPGGYCQVWVKNGTYATGTTSSVIQMKMGTRVYGGFSGSETYFSERGDPWAFPSTLDGMDVTYHVVNGASNTVLDGFVVTRGNANLNAWDGGGGMVNYGSNTLIKNCIFHHNSGAMYGGAMRNGSSDSTIDSCIFHSNSSFVGAGINMSYPNNVTVSRCDFAGNFGDGTSSSGAGIYINAGVGSSLLVYDCVFNGNGGVVSGAGIENSSVAAGTVSIVNSGFSFNQAEKGAAIHNVGGSPTIINCVFNGNFGYDSGYSGMYAGKGAGMYSEAWTVAGELSEPTVINSTFSHNGVYDGTFPEAGVAGGIYTAADGSNTTLINTIVYGNDHGDIVGPYSNWFSIIGSATYPYVPYISNVWGAGTSLLSYDALKNQSTIVFPDNWFTPGQLRGKYLRPFDLMVWNYYIVDNGINTITIWGLPTTAIPGVTFIIFDYHIGAGSPCVDTGATVVGLDYDYDGFPRPGPRSTVLDVGAFEYQGY